MAKRYTVKKLAIESNVDADEALVLLWEEGLEYVEGADRYINNRDLKKARLALGIAGPRELLHSSYWCRLFGISEEEFKVKLTDLDIRMRPSAKRLPKGAIAKLKAEARRKKKHTLVLNENKKDLQEESNSSDLDPVIWETIGKPRELNMISEAEVESIHEALVRDFRVQNDPIEPAGIKNRNLFSSAIYRPQTSLGNQLKYPTAEMAGAALLHSIILNHPFHNGNKRTAIVAMIVFLDENGLILTCSEDDLFKIVLLIAKHRLPDCIYKSGEPVTDRSDREVLSISRWISSNSREIELGNRPIQWRRLKKILHQYDCTIEHAGRNRLNIKRQKSERRRFGSPKVTLLRTQVYCGGDGRDAEANTIVKIRKDLHLDEQNGNIDTATFYRADTSSADDFINRYRKTLKRLSNL